MRKWMKQMLSVTLCAVMALTAVFANTGVANAEEADTYKVKAEFLKADGTASSAYDAIVNQEAVVKVKEDGTISATLQLQETSGMSFYNFQYLASDGEYVAAEYTGEEEAPDSITIPELPDTSGVVVLKATYPNPVLGTHEVTVYLHLDLEEVLNDINNAEQEPGEDEEDNEDKDEDKDDENEDNENEENNEEVIAKTYEVKAEFLKADGTASSAYDAIVDQKAVVEVKDDVVTATIELQEVTMSGMTVNFYNFKYLSDGEYIAAAYTGEEEAPDRITIELPDMTGEVEMLTTYPNDFFPDGVHEVTIYLSLDLADVLKDTEETEDPADKDGNTEDPGNTEVPGDEDNGKEQNGEEELDINNLPDGIYEVPVALWHATEDQASMGAAGLLGATDEDPWSTARIVVEEGEYTMYIYTQEMQFGVLSARLQSFQVEGENAQTIGTEWEDPTAFYFVMPYVDEYMNVAINTGEGSVMGNNYVAARQKTDWDEIVKVSDDTDVTKAPEDEVPVSPLATDPVTTAQSSDDTTTATSGAAQTGDTTSLFGYIMALILAFGAAAYGTKNKWMGTIKK